MGKSHITAFADLPMLTVYSWGSRFSTKSPGLTGAFENLTVFPGFLPVKNFHCWAYHFDYGRLVFAPRHFPYINKRSETPINSGYTIIREIIWCCVLNTLTVTILSPLYLLWWKKKNRNFFQCKQIWRKRNHFWTFLPSFVYILPSVLLFKTEKIQKRKSHGFALNLQVFWGKK